MCFYVDKYFAREKKAKENIYVIKDTEEITKDSNGKFKFVSSIKKKVYLQNGINKKIKLKIKKGFGYLGNEKTIEEGYHSYYEEYFNIDRLKEQAIFMIPKNTRYYLSRAGEIVSSEIIFIEPLINYLKDFKSLKHNKTLILEKYNSQLVFSRIEEKSKSSFIIDGENPIIQENIRKTLIKKARKMR